MYDSSHFGARYVWGGASLAMPEVSPCEARSVASRSTADRGTDWELSIESLENHDAVTDFIFLDREAGSVGEHNCARRCSLRLQYLWESWNLNLAANSW